MQASKPPPAEEPRAERREEDRGLRPRDRTPRKERLLKDDGRYIVFYDFEDVGEERG